MIKLIKHIKNYILPKIIFINKAVAKKSIVLSIKLCCSFVYYDILYQFYIKKKYRIKIEEHNNYIRNYLKISKDWFSNNIGFLYYLIDKYNLKSKNLKILEIGSFEGNSTFFLLKNFSNSQMTCVDTFLGSDEHFKINFDKTYENFKHNTNFYKDSIETIKTNSKNFFEKKLADKKFDIIYIDGSHAFDDVLYDSINAFKCLNENGIIIFDDFLWNFYNNDKKNPIDAINIFLNNFSDKLEILLVYYQLIIKKKNQIYL